VPGFAACSGGVPCIHSTAGVVFHKSNSPLKAPDETSRAAIAEGDQIVQSRRARFATADALFNDIEEASRK
jgi:hypothetical protein